MTEIYDHCLRSVMVAHLTLNLEVRTGVMAPNLLPGVRFPPEA